MASSSAAMARCTSFFTMSSYSSFTTREQLAGSACAVSSLVISEWCCRPALQLVQHHERVDRSPRPGRATRALEILSWM